MAAFIIMDKNTFSETAVYQFRVKGVLEQRWTHWFEGMTIIPNRAQQETTFTGVVIDQAALHGLLARIRDLGLPLIACYRVETES